MGQYLLILLATLALVGLATVSVVASQSGDQFPGQRRGGGTHVVEPDE